MNGIIIVDKPAEWTSHDVIAKLRGVLRVKRIGHGGTLDPLATGVLPIFIGRATRAVEFCESFEKEYIAGLRLGVTTDTQDITGTVTDVREVSVTKDGLCEALTRFRGAQKQIPPMYSAVKINGKKLYELARRGADIERPARDIFVSVLELTGGADCDYTLRVVCSKGTYIRTLCHDIGRALGCGGALCSLRRTRAGIYGIDAAHSLESILEHAKGGAVESLLMPVDSVFAGYPEYGAGERETFLCKNGNSFRAPDMPDGRYRVYGAGGDFLMLGEVCGGFMKTVKSFFEVC